MCRVKTLRVSLLRRKTKSISRSRKASSARYVVNARELRAKRKSDSSLLSP